MFQHIARWTFLITIWKKYKGQLLATLAYIVAILLIGFVHKDYLDFVAASNQGQGYIAMSFTVKWVAYLAVTGFYYWVFTRFSKEDKKGHEGLGFLNRFEQGKGKSGQAKTKASASQEQTTDSLKQDPFSNIRAKDKLRSEADLILDRQAKKPKN